MVSRSTSGYVWASSGRIGLFGTKTVLIPVQFVETAEVRKTLVIK
jgi:hypothetical protein